MYSIRPVLKHWKVASFYDRYCLKNFVLLSARPVMIQVSGKKRSFGLKFLIRTSRVAFGLRLFGPNDAFLMHSWCIFSFHCSLLCKDDLTKPLTVNLLPEWSLIALCSRSTVENNTTPFPILINMDLIWKISDKRISVSGN